MDEPTTKPSILCIEDENFIGELYSRALTNAGYNVKVVGDGQAALTEAQTNAYDIILLDIMLPTMNGVDILHSLKDPGLPAALKAKIIITTNLDQEKSVREKIEKMADGYLIKAEITPHELVEYLQQIQL